MTPQSFLLSESGAVTVDWVVLTAAMVGLGMAAMAVVSGGVENASGEISTELASLEVGFSFATDAVAAMDWSAYAPLSPQHGTSWGNNGLDGQGLTWAQNTYTGWSQLDDTQLQAVYAEHYAFATSNPTGWMETQTRADYVAISEQIMLERGLTVPTTNLSASALRATF